MALHVRAVCLPDDAERDLYIVDGRLTFERVPGAETVATGGYALPGLVDAARSGFRQFPLQRNVRESQATMGLPPSRGEATRWDVMTRCVPRAAVTQRGHGSVLLLGFRPSRRSGLTVPTAIPAQDEIAE